MALSIDRLSDGYFDACIRAHTTAECAAHSICYGAIS